MVLFSMLGNEVNDRDHEVMKRDDEKIFTLEYAFVGSC